MLEAADVHERLFAGLDATERHHRVEFEGAGHLMGTYRMGSDPATSVVDADQRSHDHANLFLLGSGVFPTVGTANPTLTIAALAAARHAGDPANCEIGPGGRPGLAMSFAVGESL